MIKKRTKFDPNVIICNEGVCIMKLYNAYGIEISETVFDEKYLEEVKEHKWYLRGDGYVARREGNKTIRLHHLIKPLKKGLVIDHIDRNPLNNIESNLRLVKQSVNCKNTVGRGYTWDKSRNKWVSQIMVNYKNKYLGRFDTKSEAESSYLKAKEKYHFN